MLMLLLKYSDTRQEKRLLCAQNCTMMSPHVMLRHVTSRHVVVYFQVAMLSALLDSFLELSKTRTNATVVNVSLVIKYMCYILSFSYSKNRPFKMSLFLIYVSDFSSVLGFYG